MRINLLILTLLFLLNACTQLPKQISSTLTIIEDESGESIKEDDFLSITYVEKTEEGKLVSSSHDYDDRPALMFRHRSDFKGDFFHMLGYLSQGDSAEFKVSIDSVINTTGRNRPHYAKGTYLIYYVRVNQVINRGELNDSLFNAAIEEFKGKENEKAKGREQKKLNNYVRANKLKLLQTPSGLNYCLLKQGIGLYPSVNDTVLVNYTAKALTGKIIDTSDSTLAMQTGIYNKAHKFGPIKIPVLPQGNTVLSGFLEAAGLLPKGAKALLILPSKRAYGSAQYKVLQPYTPLICELEILEVIKQNK